MGVPFIGDDGFYPKWARGAGRWVCQRVPVSLTNWPPVADGHGNGIRWLVWVPPSSHFRWLASRREHDAHSAWDELCWLGSHFGCPKCGPRQQAHVPPHYMLADPAEWWVMCEHCLGSLALDLQGLNCETIVRRWHETGRPALDPPNASQSAILAGVGPVGNLEDWIARMKPLPGEMAYIGQQLWPNLLSFLEAAAPRPEDSRRRENRGDRHGD